MPLRGVCIQTKEPWGPIFLQATQSQFTLSRYLTGFCYAFEVAKPEPDTSESMYYLQSVSGKKDFIVKRSSVNKTCTDAIKNVIIKVSLI